MSRKPIPPAPAPEPNRIGNVSPRKDDRSAYWGMDAPETVDAYLKGIRSIKVQSIALLLADCAATIYFAETGQLVLYLLGLGLVFGIAIMGGVRAGRSFLRLGEVVSRDCDPARYRAVIDAIAERDRRGRSANVIAVERAYCDYLELDSVSALRRLDCVAFRRRGTFWWFRAMQVEFLSRLDLGDIDGARDALTRLSSFRRNYRNGTRHRASTETLLADYIVLLRGPDEWDAADAARMRERMVLADCHQQRVNWQLHLAEYELLHGSREEAARLASDSSLEPLTTRMERLRAEILMRADG